MSARAALGASLFSAMVRARLRAAGDAIEFCCGEGKCHGPMGWCDACGDVDNVCDDTTGGCMSHFCGGCRRGPTSIMDYLCEPCRDQEHVEELEQQMVEALKNGNDRKVDKLAREIDAFMQREKIRIEFKRWDGGR